MKTKLLYFLLFSITMSLSTSAQIEGKNFSANLEGIGKVNLQFKEKVYELSNPAEVVLVKGNFEIDENKITLTDTEGPVACQKDVKGEYEFVYKDRVLNLTIISDTCPGRKSIGSATWKETN